VVEEGGISTQGDRSVTHVPTYVHTIEGRLRIKVPEVKGSARRARDIERQFATLTPIEFVSANPVTGNVLFLYDAGSTSSDEIVDAVHAVGYLRDGASVSRSEPGTTTWSNLLLRASTELALQKLIAALI
jgi:heavy-metal-associated domain-containing protein